MSAAAFVLGINFFIAGIFAAAFGTVAAYARSAVGARWLALAYGLGGLNPLLEFILPYQVDARPVQLAIFAVLLFAFCLCVVGLSRHYRQPPPWRMLGVLIAVSLLANLMILDMPRDSVVRATLYQLPYFFAQLLAVATILRGRQHQLLDLALMVLLALSALQFLFKPLLAGLIGSGTSPQDYITSTYAAISLSVGAVLLIANGLLMLLIIVRDAMAEITARSETDKLSGLLNRRGFEDRTGRQMSAALRDGLPSAMIVADLDHFKTINDTFGHEAGDRVIGAFANALATAPAPAVIGRIGGEEFAVFVPGANLASARLYAEGVRTGFSAQSIAGLAPNMRISASFGVAQLADGDSLSDLLRRADAALYEAKRSGRDRVCVSAVDALTARIVNPGGPGRQGSRRAD